MRHKDCASTFPRCLEQAADASAIGRRGVRVRTRHRKVSGLVQSRFLQANRMQSARQTELAG